MQTIKLYQIRRHPLQSPDRARDTTELQGSHRQVGVLRPPIVIPDGCGGYRCLAGWRTITAAKAMGLEEMLCIVREDLVGNADKQFAVFVQSNIHRELTALEKADIIKASVGDGRDLRHVARQMAISRTEAMHLQRLADAPDEVKELIKRGGRGRDGLSFSTFKSELSALSNEQMIERLWEAGDLSRKALKRTRQRAEGNMTERMIDSTDDILKVIQVIRHSLGQVEVFLRTATEGAKDEVRVALGPVIKLWEEVRDDSTDAR